MDVPYQPLHETKEDEIKQITLSERGIKKLDDFIARHQGRMNTAPEKDFENLYALGNTDANFYSDKHLLNTKFLSIRNIDNETSLRKSSLVDKDVLEEIQKLKIRNQSTFQPYAFLNMDVPREDFAKPFHSEKKIQKVKITFDEKTPAPKKETTKKKRDSKIKKAQNSGKRQSM